MKPIKHVAIIMDGNGRWGLKKKNNRNFGHKEGLKTVEKIVNQAIKENIDFLTLYTFSTENWKRPISEINFLFNMLETFLDNKIDNFIKKNIRLKFIGNINKLNKLLVKKLLLAENKTKNNQKLQINLALNYGSKNEIINSFNNLKKKKLRFTSKNLEKNLFTKDIPDPEILIRTGNTNRLSNFMLWQLAYTEIFFEKKFWPDFNENDFSRILKNFRKINRKFGALNE
jgi:undecaprenyl diphosphate synthase